MQPARPINQSLSCSRRHAQRSACRTQGVPSTLNIGTTKERECGEGRLPGEAARTRLGEIGRVREWKRTHHISHRFPEETELLCDPGRYPQSPPSRVVSAVLNSMRGMVLGWWAHRCGRRRSESRTLRYPCAVALATRSRERTSGHRHPCPNLCPVGLRNVSMGKYGDDRRIGRNAP